MNAIVDNPEIWYLRGLGLTRRLSGEVLERLSSEGKLERWGHRASLSRNESSGLVSLVLSGGIEGHESAMSFRLKPGDLFGETGAGFESAALTAYDDTVICTLSRDAFADLTSTELGQLETTVGIRNRRRLTVPIELLLYATPVSRLTRVLVKLIDDVGTRNGTQATLPVNLKPRHLADLTGFSPGQSRNVLNVLRSANLVEIGRMGLVLPDMATIEALSSPE